MNTHPTFGTSLPEIVALASEIYSDAPTIGATGLIKN
jgi:hypothetical protein